MYWVLIIVLASIIASIVVAKSENKKYDLFIKNRNDRIYKDFLELTDREKRKLEYAEYLKTDHWQEMRAKALERAGYKCQLCSSEEMLQVHHNTYKNIGNEKLTDLVVLCRGCHSRFHNKPY